MKILSFVIMSFQEIDQGLENIAISFCHFMYSVNFIKLLNEGGGVALTRVLPQDLF